MIPPSISVIMAVCNGERFLEEAITSVLGQTFRDFEFIVVNDGSTDRSLEILEDFARRDSRIVLVSQENRGIARSLNRAIALAKCGLLAHIDGDDRALPTWLERQMDFLLQHPECSVVSSYAYFINPRGERIGISGNPVEVARGRAEMNPSRFLEVVHSTVLMRKSDILAVGGYREGLSGLEDRDLWGRIVTAGLMMRCNSERLVEYRLHGRSVSVSGFRNRDDAARRGIDLNVVRRMRGDAELSVREMELWLQGRPPGDKFKQWLQALNRSCLNRAIRHYAEKRWLSFAFNFSMAVALRPLFTLRRAIAKTREL